MITGSLAVVADLEDLPDLGECESGCLPAMDEVDALYGLVRVVTIATGCARSGRQEPLFFVEAERLRRDPDRIRKFADTHVCP